MNDCRPASRGFTLLEVLVALAILAVALAAAMRVAGLSAATSSELKQRTLALWVAQNRMAEHQARSDWPAVGVASGQAEQAGMAFRWEETVSATPNGDFRRVEIRVFPGDGADHALAQLSGYLLRKK